MFLLDNEESVVSIFGENNIFVVFHNNGLESSCHSFETPKSPVEFKKLTLTRGGSCPVRNKEEFSKIAQEYMSVNEFETCFPPEHLIKNKDVKCITKHLFTSKSSLKKALVGYSYIDHLKVYGYTDRDLAYFSSSATHHKAILLFDDQRSLVIYIRVCEENPTTGGIRQEMKMCDEFIKAFLLLHEKAVTSGVLSICAFVALPGMCSKDMEDKTIFVNNHQDFGLFLVQEDFENYDSFKKIIDNSHNLAKDLQKNLGTKPKKSPMINKILAECMASMTFITDAFLPRLSRDEHTQVLSLFLNVEQYEAIRNPNKKRIIRGPFGSGKSLIMEKIIEELISSTEKCTIYYIMYEPYSLLEARMDEVFAELSKKSDASIKLCSTNIHKLLEEANHSTANNTIETVMKYCLEQSKDYVVHFLFDEVDCAYFTEENASGLKEYIDKKNDDTTLILALQCTEKEQIVHKEKSKYDVHTYCQDENNTTGMTLIKPLTKSMRMVTNIYELKKIAEDVIKPHSTKLALKEDTDSKISTDSMNKSTSISNSDAFPTHQPNNQIRNSNSKIPKFKRFKRFLTSIPSIQKASTRILRTPTRNPTSSKNISSSISDVDVKHSPIISSPPSAEIKIPDITEPSVGIKGINKADSNEHKTETIKKVQSPTQIPLDQIPIHNREFLTDYIDQSSHFFEITYNFHKSENGVSIKGSGKPSIIYLDDSLDMESSKAALILSMIFESECFVDKSSKKTTIICNDWLEALLTLFGLKLSNFQDDEYCEYIPLLLNNGIPSKQEKKSIWERCNSIPHSILVTDFQGFRGCETEICVTFIDPDDSYLRHILVEIIARAVTNLVIIVLPSTVSVKPKIQGNFRQVLDAWVHKEVVDVYRIDISQNKFSLKKENENGVVVLSSGKFESKDDEEFEQFKSTWEKKKGNFYPDTRR